MPRKRKLLNLSERCRICLSESGEMRDLFTEPYWLKLKDLTDCTSVEIKNEQNLPKNICHACVYKLEMWNEFKERFIRSNRLLMTRLESTEVTDNSAIQPKRKYSEVQVSSDDNNLDENKKKLRSENSPLRISSPNFEGQESKGVNSSPFPGLTSQIDTIDFATTTDIKNEVDNDLNSCVKPCTSPKRQQSARRGRATERRKAYTRRWVARKRALIAATGNNSDTDSGVSDNQLSPVQKARAKSNAEKEDEKKKKIARALKNLETNMNDFKRGSDSDAQRMLRSRTTRNQNRKSTEKVKEKEKSKTKEQEEKETEKENISMQPQTLKSELKIGDTTYIVTSTLVISEPTYLNKNLTDALIDHDKNENTDIIDAVQLKRVKPASNVPADKRLLERCLNIEVEGTELEALQRVQVDLASFIEKDMKEKIFSENNFLENLKGQAKDSYESLDHQLKTIVVKAIKKNYETSLQKSVPDKQEDDEKSKTVSPEFVKAALHSAIFQPKLTLTRLDFTCLPCKINNAEALRAKTEAIQNLRQTLLPLMSIGDNNVSGDDKHLGEECFERKPKQASKHLVESVECDTTTHQDLQNADNFSSPQSKITETYKEQKILRDSQNLQNQVKHSLTHRCSICGRLFSDRREAEEHVKSHRDRSNKPREKLMRCKRCHEIVAARYVKLHVCSQQYKCSFCNVAFPSEKSFINHMANHNNTHTSTALVEYKCTICNKQFSSENYLVKHLSTHDETKSTLKCNVCDVDFISEQALMKHLQTHDKSELEKPLRSKIKKLQVKKQEVSEQLPNFERKGLNVKLEKKTTVEVPHKTNPPKKHEGYTCFVCDKKFNDEEVMKDHLQQHCDDLSEEEENSSKEHYQCAICGESFDSEDSLGTHVENHLFDDGDDNPNLINITENGKPKETKYYCDQCPEEFSSKAIFAMHKEVHEEENAIAEWEKQRNIMHDHSCTICDEVFQSEEELAEHLDIHNESAHICLLCEKSFATLPDLQVHVESH